MPVAIFLLMALISLSPTFVLSGPPGSAFQSKEMSISDSILGIQKRKNSVAIDYFFPKMGRSSERRRTVIRVPNEIVRSQFFDVAIFAAFNDEVSAIEVTGDCGNKVCERLIYRFNKSPLAYQLFFRGAYSSASIFDDHLVGAGPSGCCAFEYHAFKISKNGQSISGAPQVTIEVSNGGAPAGSDVVECAFSDEAGGRIAAPNQEWLSFCRVYGDVYQLRK